MPERPVIAAAVSAVRVRTAADDARVLVDGRPVRTAGRDGALLIGPPGLRDGRHELQVEVPSWLGTGTTTREFIVDSTPPVLQVDDSLRPSGPNKPVTVTGKAEGATSVTVAGKPVTPNAQGGFSAVVDRPEREVPVVATDAAGNRTEKVMTVHIRHPGMRGVHMTGLAWTSDALREPVLQLAREGKIDTVELDLKDEDGEVTYDSAVPLAREIGAVKGYYNARQVLDQLHHMGVRVVGRLVAFKDPILAEASCAAATPNASCRPPTGSRGQAATASSRSPTSPIPWCGGTTSTSRRRPPGSASTTCSTTTCAVRTATSTRCGCRS